MPNVKEFYLNKLDGSCDFEMDDNSVRSMKLVDVQSLVSGARKPARFSGSLCAHEFHPCR